jgi:transposase InsO family protein
MLLLVVDGWRHVLHVGDAPGSQEQRTRCYQKIVGFHTDNMGAFTSTKFAAYCADEVRHFSAPYGPWQNGVVEQQNQTVVVMALALLKQRSMPAKF